MALTVGTGPFAPRPAGVFNFFPQVPERVLYFEDSPRRVRAVAVGETVADSVRVKLLHETGQMPVYYFPEGDVRHELLEPTERTTRCPAKGDATYWTLRVAGERRDDAVWSYPDPVPGASFLAGHLAFRWDAVDEWWEEAERIDVHPRDPYHRCDVVASDRHVVVRLHGAVLAESHRPVMLFETGLPPRFYLPPDDVHHGHVVPSPTVTQCPYKGTTSHYHTAVVGDHRVEDVAWTYDDPRPEVTGIDGLVAFYNEKVDLEVDGVHWDRPRTRLVAS